MRMVNGLFNYINHPAAVTIINRNIRDMRSALVNIRGAAPQLCSAVSLFDEFVQAWYQHAAPLRRNWLRGVLNRTQDIINNEIRIGNRVPGARKFIAEIKYLLSRFDDMVVQALEGA
jgi:hypothetical protein